MRIIGTYWDHDDAFRGQHRNRVEHIQDSISDESSNGLKFAYGGFAAWWTGGSISISDHVSDSLGHTSLVQSSLQLRIHLLAKVPLTTKKGVISPKDGCLTILTNWNRSSDWFNFAQFQETIFIWLLFQLSFVLLDRSHKQSLC